MIYVNVIVNYLGTAIIGIINIVSLSQYIKIFGMSQWGEVSTYVAILNSLMILELGISQIYGAQYHSRSSDPNLFVRFRTTLFSLALTGSIITLTSFLVLSMVRSDFPVVYQKWDLLVLTLILFILSLVNNFYYTNLTVMGRQIEQNIRWVAFVILKNSLAIGLALGIGNTPKIYFVSFVIVGVIELCANSYTRKESLLSLSRFSEVLSVIRKSWLYFISIGIGVLVFSLDRLILPTVVSSETFGVYSSVVTIGLYFLQLQYPITKALFPVLAKRYSLLAGKSSKLIWLPPVVLGLFVAPFLLLASSFSMHIFRFYSVPAAYYEGAHWLFNGVLISVLINAIYSGFYMQLVIEAKSLLIAKINFMTMISSFLILSIIGKSSPFIAGALSWCSISLLQIAGFGVLYRGRSHEA